MESDATSNQRETQSTNQTKTFNPPVDTVVVPPRYRAKRWEDITKIKYDIPYDCGVKLVPQYEAGVTTNPEFIRIAKGRFTKSISREKTTKRLSDRAKQCQ